MTTCPTCELMASDTSFADAAQKWECEKAELVNALKRLTEQFQAYGNGWLGDAWRIRIGLPLDLQIAEAVIRKYEVPD